jgi:hypothetical protein
MCSVSIVISMDMMCLDVVGGGNKIDVYIVDGRDSKSIALAS